MEHLNDQVGIYLGDRGEKFRTLISGVLKKGGLRKKYRTILLSPKSMEKYGSAFTHEMVDENYNYQVYEQLGDLSGNKFIVWYIYKRFPQLKCKEGVKVAARLRINYGSKNSFYKIAEELGFWDFISATHELRQRKKKSLLEDVFEAFLGVTELILDDEVIPDQELPSVGYVSVYKILKSIFDEMDISLKYEDLYDSKTRLKELFDIHVDKLGPLVYEEHKEELPNGNVITHSTVYRLSGGQYAQRPDGTVNMKKIVGRYQKVKIGEGSAALKSDAQQMAATDAIENLRQQGFVKYAPRIYAKFSGDYKDDGETTAEDIIRIVGSPVNINEQFPTRGKSKHQSKYTSTVLGKYARERDYEGIKLALKMGADPNVPDSEGLSALDLLLIGPVDVKLVKKVMKKFLKSNPNLTIFTNIYDVYYSKYLTADPEFFSTINMVVK